MVTPKKSVKLSAKLLKNLLNFEAPFLNWIGAFSHHNPRKTHHMVKRFTPQAGDYTNQLCQKQIELSQLRKQVTALEDEVKSLQTYLRDYYNQGTTPVEYGKTQLEVTYTVTPRMYLDQDACRNTLNVNNLEVPEYSVDIVVFKVKDPVAEAKAKAAKAAAKGPTAKKVVPAKKKKQLTLDV